jgi:hypothetical protein
MNCQASLGKLQMKQLIVIVSSLAVLYASAVWAVEGCRNISIAAGSHHHAGDVVSTHPENPAPSQRTHSHSDKIHCLNFFGEFLLSARVSLDPGRDAARYATCDTAQLADVSNPVMARQRINGPPTSRVAKSFPRHLLLSVLLI